MRSGALMSCLLACLLVSSVSWPRQGESPLPEYLDAQCTTWLLTVDASDDRLAWDMAADVDVTQYQWRVQWWVNGAIAWEDVTTNMLVPPAPALPSNAGLIEVCVRTELLVDPSQYSGWQCIDWDTDVVGRFMEWQTYCPVLTAPGQRGCRVACR